MIKIDLKIKINIFTRNHHTALYRDSP